MNFLLIIDLICTCNKDILLYLRVADANESNCAMFTHILQEFHKQGEINVLFVLNAVF